MTGGGGGGKGGKKTVDPCKALVDHCIECFTSFNSKKSTIDSHIDLYLTSIDCVDEGDAVFIKKCGSAVVLIPRVNSWDTLIGSLDKFSDDYMTERNQPAQQQRETLFK